MSSKLSHFSAEGSPSPLSAIPGLSEAAPFLNAISHAVVLHEASGRVIYANEAAQRVLGLSLDQLQGRTALDPCWRSIHEDGRPYPGEEHPAMLTLKSGQGVDGALMGVYNPCHGEMRWIEIWSRPLFRDSEAQPFQALATFIDVTEQKRAQDQRQMSVDVLEVLHREDDPTRVGQAILDIIRKGFRVDSLCIRLSDEKAFEVVAQVGFTPQEMEWAQRVWRAHQDRDALVSEPEKNEAKTHCLLNDFPAMAIIPIAGRNKNLGVLQLCRRQPEPFNEQDIHFLEHLSQSIGLALERKQTLDALARSLEYLEYAHQSAQSGSWEWEIENGGSTWSPSLIALFGLEPGSVQASHEAWKQIVHPDDRAMAHHVSADCLASGLDIEMEFRIQRPDGEVRWLLSRGKAIKAEDGHVLRYLGIAVDITERKRSELRLRDSESRFRVAFDNAPLLMGIADVEKGEHIFVNQTFLKLTGLKQEEVIGRRSDEVGWVRPEDRAEIKRKLAAEGAVSGMALDIFTRNGDVLNVLFNCNFFEMEGRAYMLTSAQDVTHTKCAQELMRRQAEELDLFFKTNLDLLCLAGLDGTFLKLNPEWERCLGYPLNELEGRCFLDLVHPDDLDGTLAAIQTLQGGEDVKLFTNRYRCKDGSYRFIEWRSASKGHLIYAAARDITERIESERSRFELEHRLHQSQKLESLGSLAGGVAHDINNVLGAIMNLASALQATITAADPMAKSMDTMIKACTRGRDVVKSLLVFARKELQEQSALDLNQIIRDLAHLLRHSTFSRVEICLELQEGLPMVIGEISTLSHAIMNVCVNAVDAMPEGGVLTLETSLGPQGGPRVRIRDTGHGMEGRVLEKATEPFFTTKEVGKGTGLGLSMVYGAIKAHGGNLKIESQVDIGTIVTLDFPAVNDSKDVPESLDQKVDHALKIQKHRVLLVDDDELVLESTLLLLEHLGHQVEVASSGEAALKSLDNGLEPDLVILDMNMPGRSGSDVLPLIRERRPELPILIATGFNDGKVDDLMERYPKVSAISKPYTLDEIRQALLKV